MTTETIIVDIHWHDDSVTAELWAGEHLAGSGPIAAAEGDTADQAVAAAFAAITIPDPEPLAYAGPGTVTIRPNPRHL